MRTIPAHEGGVHQPAGPILFFDDHCSVCRRFIRMVVHADRQGRLRIAPLGGSLAAALRHRYPALAGRKSAVWLPQSGPPVDHADAILAVLAYLGGLWRAFTVLGSLVPRSVRNWIYGRFAAHRALFAWLGLPALDDVSVRRVIDQSYLEDCHAVD